MTGAFGEEIVQYKGFQTAGTIVSTLSRQMGIEFGKGFQQIIRVTKFSIFTKNKQAFDFSKAC